MEECRKRFIVLGANTPTGKAIVKALAPHCGILFACFRSVQEIRRQKRILKKYKSVKICIIPDNNNEVFLNWCHNFLWHSIIVEGVVCISSWKPSKLFQLIRPLLRDGGKFITVGGSELLLPEDTTAKNRGITTYSFSNATAPVLVKEIM